MSVDCKYFLAGGESERKVREFFEKRTAAFKEADVLAKEVGGTGAAVSRCMVGVIFEGTVPDGWTCKGWAGPHKYYMPLRKSKAGRALAERISSISIPGAIDLHSEFSKSGGELGEAPNGGIFIAYISAEIVGGKAIITVPEQMDFTPPESTPLKLSEYWALKEKQKETEQ